MSRQELGRLMELWINDPRFREHMRRDPEGAVRAVGAELDPDEWAALRAIDWSLPDEELQKRYYSPADALGAER